MANRSILGDPEFSASVGPDDIDIVGYADRGFVHFRITEYRTAYHGTEDCSISINEDQARELRDMLNDFLELRAARVQQG